MKKILFIDRDGTLIIETDDKQIDSLEKLVFYPGAIVNLHRIVTELDYDLVMVSNQDGLGTDLFPEDTFWPVQHLVLKTLEGEGIIFSEILIDRSLPHENKSTRKPGTALLSKYLDGSYDLENSFVIGDRETDIQLAENLGCKAIFVGKKQKRGAALTTTDWYEIYRFLRYPDRSAVITRKTRETDIRIELNIDGSGVAKISTGLGFFDHMLELFAKHAAFDLKIKVKGDLHVDEHHTIEDTAIALGEAVARAAGNKAGIERYGFLLPMDESIAWVALDLSGRNELVWKVKFKRERVGELPTEMIYHFFKSFSDSARCNLYIKAKGKNEHHKVEAIFKSLARALRQAVHRDKSQEIPSTKGIL